VTEHLPYKDLADLLGVSSNQVYMWHERRASNGFPEATGVCKKRRPGPKGSPVFDPVAVLNWYRDYEPSRGGAPRGNRNGFKPGNRFGGTS